MPYSLAFGTRAIILVEVPFTSLRVQQHQPEHNVEILRLNLVELEERRDLALVRNAESNQVL